MKYLKTVQVDTITSVALSTSRLTVSTYRDGFTPAPNQFNVHFNESNLEAMGEFNDTLITLVRNQKIYKHLGSKLDDKGKQLFKPGYVLDFENTKTRSDTKGKHRPMERTKSDSQARSTWRAGQMKKFYVYLFSEALVSIHPSDKECWTKS